MDTGGSLLWVAGLLKGQRFTWYKVISEIFFIAKAMMLKTVAAVPLHGRWDAAALEISTQVLAKWRLD